MARKILLIDDDYDFVAATKTTVEASGYEVEVAHNGKEGLKKAKKAKADLIVLDVIMPGLDGWQVCQALKESPETKKIPVTMLTAVASKVKETAYSHQDGKQTEADDYVPKPVEIPVLLERIKRLLR